MRSGAVQDGGADPGMVGLVTQTIAPQNARPVTMTSRRWGARSAKLAIAAFAALLAANCSAPTFLSGKNASELKYGVRSSPRVIPDGEPIPKGGGRDTTGQPYVVAGRTYVPHPGKGYRREGWASWYGSAFHGRLTANGEIFDRESIAAAHPTLPLPSYVRVTNLVNNRSMIVRVNDRGPYEQDRVIDVSERVATALDFKRRGTSRVRVEYVGKASLSGSDDEKLYATLRTEAAPDGAGTGARRFATSADHDPHAFRPTPNRDAPSRRRTDDDEEPRRATGRSQMAEAGAERAPPLDIRPPTRPVDLGEGRVTGR